MSLSPFWLGFSHSVSGVVGMEAAVNTDEVSVSACYENCFVSTEIAKQRKGFLVAVISFLCDQEV